MGGKNAKDYINEARMGVREREKSGMRNRRGGEGDKCLKEMNNWGKKQSEENEVERKGKRSCSAISHQLDDGSCLQTRVRREVMSDILWSGWAGEHRIKKEHREESLCLYLSSLILPQLPLLSSPLFFVRGAFVLSEKSFGTD